MTDRSAESPAVSVERLNGEPSFEDGRHGWWGYRVSVPDRPPFEYWVLGAEFSARGGGYIQRDVEDERLGDGRSLTNEDDPHPDDYYDEVWDLIIKDLLTPPTPVG